MKKQFTLIELLVVIAIIGILISMIFPALNSARISSQKAVCINNLKALGNGMALFLIEGDSANGIDKGYYPDYGNWYKNVAEMINSPLTSNKYVSGNTWQCPAPLRPQ
ncbi:MAG: type II secretion system protein, partial [Lentisphaeraceae bacterium]|nr:type II secretion system protein [Lentisphaeraceae bacterium]